jgi:hypothetical protein
VIESLLQSILQCFYNQTCINVLQTYLSSSLSEHFENSTIKKLLDHLTIEERSATIMYDKYYEQYQPVLCTFTGDIVETRINVVNIAIIMIFLVGGPIPALKLVISLLANIIACCVRRSPRQVVSDTLIMHT